VNPLDLPPTTESVPAARRFVREQLADSELDVDTAVLLGSELVTNAILHARTQVTVTVELNVDLARISVRDRSPVQPRIHAFSTSAATGRGLRLLDRLAERWGVDSESPTDGKVVWFEVGPPSQAAWTAFADDWLEEAGNDF
jgi:anti-sigma regulatory factor (Ser/Thr protein kinase)